MSRDMWFPTMWLFVKCRLRRAFATSCQLRNSKWYLISSLTVRIFKQQAKALICAYAQSGLSLCWSHIPHFGNLMLRLIWSWNYIYILYTLFQKSRVSSAYRTPGYLTVHESLLWRNQCIFSRFATRTGSVQTAQLWEIISCTYQNHCMCIIHVTMFDQTQHNSISPFSNDIYFKIGFHFRF